MKTALTLLVALSLALTLFCAAIGFVVKSDSLYWTLAAKDITNDHNLSEDQIRRNYSTLMEYCLSLREKDLELEKLPMSDSGRSHFRDVRQLFTLIQLVGFVSALCTALLGAFLLIRQRSGNFITLGAYLALLIPIGLAVPFIFHFDKAFIQFHQLCFSNEDWLFDPATDPIINYLPEAFFMKMAFLILGTLVLLALITFFMGKSVRSKLDR